MDNKVTRTVVYSCPMCFTLYEEQENALECCGGLQPEAGWMCIDCGMLYPAKMQAELCTS